MDIHKLARCRMKRTKKLIMTLFAVVVLGLGATAQAQDTPPPLEPPPSAHSPAAAQAAGRRRRHRRRRDPHPVRPGGPGARRAVRLRPGDSAHRGPAGLRQPPRSPAAIAQTDSCSARAAGTTCTGAPRATSRSVRLIAIDTPRARGRRTTVTAFEPGDHGPRVRHPERRRLRARRPGLPLRRTGSGGTELRARRPADRRFRLHATSSGRNRFP